MTEHRSPIPARVYNAAVGGHVCGPEDIDFGQKVVHLIKYDKDGNEVSFESQVTQANKIYVIHDDFTLSSNVTIPANCVLEFDGGSIDGAHILSGNNTKIYGDLVGIFGTSIDFGGTWNVPEIRSSMFTSLNYDNSLKKLNKLCNASVQNTVVIENHGYDYYFSSTANRDSLFAAIANTRYIINATIKERTWDVSISGFIFYVTNESKNVVIEGSGSLIGNMASNDDTMVESLSAIEVWMGDGTEDDGSTTLTDNLTIRGLHIENFGCDAVRLCNCSKVRIEQCEIVHCNRNGISLIGATMCNIEGNKISRVVHSAFDFEPNNSSSYRSDTTTSILNNVIFDCGNVLDVSTGKESINSSILFKNNYIKNCTNYINLGSNFQLVSIENNTFVDSTSTKRQIYANYATNMSCYIKGNVFKALTEIKFAHTNKDVYVQNNVFEVEGSTINISSTNMCVISGNTGSYFYSSSSNIEVYGNILVGDSAVVGCDGSFFSNEIRGSFFATSALSQGVIIESNKFIGLSNVRDGGLLYPVCLRNYGNRAGFVKSIFRNNTIIPKMTYDAALYASLSGSVVKGNIIRIEAGNDASENPIVYNTGYQVIATASGDGGITTEGSSLFEDNRIISLDSSAFTTDYDIQSTNIIKNFPPQS